MTATDALRDRIAQALHDEGAYCGNCGYEDAFDQLGCLDCQQALYGYADAVMALLADADPTDLGYVEMEVIIRYEGSGHMAEPVPYLTPVRWEDGYAEHRPQDLRIYARPRSEETPDD